MLGYAGAMSERRDELSAAMKAAGCSDPRDWVNSELGENLPQFARFLMLRDVHALADDVDGTLSEALFDRPDLEQTLATLRGAVPFCWAWPWRMSGRAQKCSSTRWIA